MCVNYQRRGRSKSLILIGVLEPFYLAAKHTNIVKVMSLKEIIDPTWRDKAIVH